MGPNEDIFQPEDVAPEQAEVMQFRQHAYIYADTAYILRFSQ